MADLLNSSTNTVIALLVAIILFCSVLIPVAMKQISNLVDMFADDASVDVTEYTSLIQLVIILAIIGLIIGVVRSFTKGEAD